MNLVDELHSIAAAFLRAGVDYAVCGDVAVTIHGATRSTKDIDFLIEPAALADALEAIRPLGYVFLALPMIFDGGTDRERNVQRVSKVVQGEHLVVDLLLAEASFKDFMSDSLEVDLPEGLLRVVSRETLLRMKRLAGRKQDLADIEKLEQHCEA